MVVIVIDNGALAGNGLFTWGAGTDTKPLIIRGSA